MTTVEKLEAIEEIKQLRAKYWRCFDNKIMGELEKMFTDDAVFDSSHALWDPKLGYLNGYPPAAPLVGKEAIVKSLETSMAADSQCAHMGHTCEVEILSDTTAKAIHPFNDRYLKKGVVYNGYGYYHDTYEKVDGVWKIKTSKIERLRLVFDE